MWITGKGVTNQGTDIISWNTYAGIDDTKFLKIIWNTFPTTLVQPPLGRNIAAEHIALEYNGIYSLYTVDIVTRVDCSCYVTFKDHKGNQGMQSVIFHASSAGQISG